MAYSERAKKLRRCTAIKKDGTCCKAWAVWGDLRQLCVAHGGRALSKKVDGDYPLYHRTVAVCTCAAYQFPHRPGGGLCRWPDPPIYISTVLAGERGVLHGLWKKFKMIYETSRVVYYVPKPSEFAWTEKTGIPTACRHNLR